MSPHTKPAPNTASCPPTAPRTPDYPCRANHALGDAAEPHSWFILLHTKCCHASSSRRQTTIRAETAPSFKWRPAKPPATWIAPGSPTEEILVVRCNAPALILHAYGFYSAILNMTYNASALRATAATTNVTYTACT